MTSQAEDHVAGLLELEIADVERRIAQLNSTIEVASRQLKQNRDLLEVNLESLGQFQRALAERAIQNT